MNNVKKEKKKKGQKVPKKVRKPLLTFLYIKKAEKV